MDRRTDSQMLKKKDGQTDEWTNGKRKGSPNGWTDRLIINLDRLMDNYLFQISCLDFNDVIKFVESGQERELCRNLIIFNN